MNFTKTTEYAIRMLAYLASEKNIFISANHLHEMLGISYRYVGKIMLTLSNAKLVYSARGKNGGYKLTKNAEKTTVKSVVNIFEPQIGEQGCLLGLPHCSSEDPCAIHQRWEKNKTQIMKMLNSVTLSELARHSGKF